MHLEIYASGEATATGGWWDYGAESILLHGVHAHDEVVFAWTDCINYASYCI